MSQHPLDSPTVINNLFYPRSVPPHRNPDETIQDGTVAIEDSVEIGYRLYIHHSSAPVLLYFHGNGEVASDYDSFAPYFHRIGLTLLVVDYRGYGWSTGTPLASKLLPDAQAVFDNVDTVFKKHGIVPARPLYLMGRSLGSAPAIYLAMNNPDAIRGLIIESGYADAPSLFRRLGIAIPDDLKDDLSLPIGNDEKMKQVTTPLLVIHGENDTLIPVSHGKTLYENATSQNKLLVIIPRAGHNNISFVDMTTYFGAIETFVTGN